MVNAFSFSGKCCTDKTTLCCYVVYNKGLNKYTQPVLVQWIAVICAIRQSLNIVVARSILVEILQAANQVNKNDSVIITRVPVLYQKKKVMVVVM